jgi:glucokinase
MTPELILAGDLGGTKTNLALFAPASEPQTPVAEASFHSREYESLASIINEFLSSGNYRVDKACLGVAGPVVDNQASITNLHWSFSGEQLGAACNLSSVVLINDLVALANGVPFLTKDDLLTLNEGKPRVDGAIGVIAPGTGLGEAFLIWSGTRYLACPSEGGHADFAPTNRTERALAAFLQQRLRHVSYEQLCSGMGLPNIYDFARYGAMAVEQSSIAEELAAADDPTPVIIKRALSADQPCSLCQAALSLFVSILGAEAGNLALKVLATGGIYLGGGIPPRILDALIRDNAFMRAFTNKGRMSSLLTDMPVHVIRNPKTALVGAAALAMRAEE